MRSILTSGNTPESYLHCLRISHTIKNSGVKKKNKNYSRNASYYSTNFILLDKEKIVLINIIF